MMHPVWHTQYSPATASCRVFLPAVSLQQVQFKAVLCTKMLIGLQVNAFAASGVAAPAWS